VPADATERISFRPQQENVASWRALEKAGFERIFAGPLESDDPSDSGPAFVYALRRPNAISCPCYEQSGSV
jgi:aminoglycoside 6'-N-acetyltransferase